MSLSGMLAVVNIRVGDYISSKAFGVAFHWSTIWSTAVAGLVVIGLGLVIRARVTSGVPGKLQLTYETVLGGVQDQVASSIGPEGARVVPLAFTLFTFILVANWLEILPLGTQPEHLPAPTSDVNLTYAMGLLVVIWANVRGIRKIGRRAYVAKFFKPSWIMLPINVIEEVVKPFTLALRLFGNLFAGSLMIILISTLFPPYISWAPDIIWKLFDMFIGVIQAFIFALLTVLYFEAAASEGGH